jgi:hypothetical protein
VMLFEPGPPLGPVGGVSKFGDLHVCQYTTNHPVGAYALKD